MFFDLFFLILPIFIAASLHMVAVRYQLWPQLAFPIAPKLFGQNKTWRGLVVMPVLGTIGVYISAGLQARLGIPVHFAWPTSLDALGMLLGFAYILAELPNSFVKRRLGIPEGKRPERARFAFVLADQADSALGCALVYWWMIPDCRFLIIPLLLIGPAVHLAGNVLLYLCKLRAEPL